jgi:hypothetical protein
MAKLPHRDSTPDRFFPAIYDAILTPDNRFQVNVLRLVALRTGDSNALKCVDEECARLQMKHETVPIVPWNAETTIFELLPDSPLDKSKGVTEYMFLDWPDNMKSDSMFPNPDQQAVVDKLKHIVFQKSNN